MIMWNVMECCAAVVLDLVLMFADLRTSETFSLSCACCK